MTERNIKTYDLNWNGIQIKISHEADWFDDPEENYKVSHLQIESVSPAKAPLPMTETGYISHFTPPDDIESAGGPIAYAQAWIEHAAKKPEWKAIAASCNQLSLF